MSSGVRVHFLGQDHDCGGSTTVLDALLAAGHTVPYSCKKGTCHACMLRATEGPLPRQAQEGIREALREQGYFLACRCHPSEDLTVSLPNDAHLYGRAVIRDKLSVGAGISRLLIDPATPLYYHPGQFINIRRPDGLIRSYSLASVPRQDAFLEIHVKAMPGGVMSTWLVDEVMPGQELELQGPNGACYYLASTDPQQPLILIATGTGLAPLLGIARDALYAGHVGSIHLYHGARDAGALYLGAQLRDLALRHANFHYVPCVSGAQVPDGYAAGRALDLALQRHPKLAGHRVFLCGAPPMVHSGKKRAYLAGASLAEIHADAFELRDLRSANRPDSRIPGGRRVTDPVR